MKPQLTAVPPAGSMTTAELLAREIRTLRSAESRLANQRRMVDRLRQRYRDERWPTIKLVPTIEQLEKELGL